VEGMKERYLIFIMAGCLLASAGPDVSAQGNIWPQFRGINCSGVAEEDQHPPVDFDREHHMIWATDLASGQSSPCIWQDRIFITGLDEEEKLFRMYCLHRETGAILWQKELPVKELEEVHAVCSPANATPASDGECVVFYFGSYGLICFDMDGKLQWELPMAIPASRHGMGTSPVIYKDLVVLNCFGHINDPCLLALDKHTGKIKWKYSGTVEEGHWVDSYSSPVIHGNQVIIYRNEDVSAYDVHSGEQVWRYPTGLGDAVCTPVMNDSILYITVFSTQGNREMQAQFPSYSELIPDYDQNKDHLITKGEIEGFEFFSYPEKKDILSSIRISDYFNVWDVNRDAYIDSAEWDGMIAYSRSFTERQGIKAIRLGRQGDISFEGFLWGDSRNVPHVSSPLYYKGLVYMVKSGGILTCLDAETGELKYSERLGTAGTYFASPIASDGRIYCTSRNGVVTVVHAGPEFKIVAKNDLDELISATPAVVDSKLYLRTGDRLYAFGE
jgi:outer membrane protein assembly factor BamB